MPYAVKHLPELDAIEVTFSGVITGADVRSATSEGISLGKTTGATKALINADGLEVSASVLDLYALPAEQYAREGLSSRNPIAIILPSSMSGRQAAHDYEVFCQNRGWNVRVCADHQAAVDWLKGASWR